MQFFLQYIKNTILQKVFVKKVFNKEFFFNETLKDKFLNFG